MSSWTLEDKSKLVSLLQEYGTSDLRLIEKKLPNKNLTEIQFICHKHRNLAVKKWHKKKEKKDDPLIKNWILILKLMKSAKKEPVQNILPRLLKYISLFEKREESNHINLTTCYQILSDITKGKPLILEDERHEYFLNDCLSRLARSVKDGEIRSLTAHLKSLHTLGDLNLNKQKNANLACSNMLNPLAIPEKLLKMSQTEKMADTI